MIAFCHLKSEGGNDKYCCCIAASSSLSSSIGRWGDMVEKFYSQLLNHTFFFEIFARFVHSALEVCHRNRVSDTFGFVYGVEGAVDGDTLGDRQMVGNCFMICEAAQTPIDQAISVIWE